MDGRLGDALAQIDHRTGGGLRTDRLSRVLYSTDASIYQVEPVAVLLPRSVEEVHAAVEVALENDLPVLVRGAGSSLAGQAVNRALVLDTTRHLDRILELDRDRRTVRVEPGIVLDELNRRLAPSGLQFGPDPASSDRAALGGVVSNNSTGAHSILYGMTADHVLEMGVILSDGSAARLAPLDARALATKRAGTGLEARITDRLAALVEDPAGREVVLAATPRHWRRCGGYNLDRLVAPDDTERPSFRWPRSGEPDRRFNLARLVCGGEGGLAVITDVTLGLVPRPAATALALVSFDRLGDAMAAVPALLECEPAAVELLDRMAIRLCRGVPRYARLLAGFLEGDPDCVLIVEMAGERPAELAGRIDRLAMHAGRATAAAGVTPVLDPARQADVWTVRKVGLGLLMSRKGDKKPIPFIEDAAVPVEHLAAYVAEIDRFCGERGTEVAYYGHASAGCVHVRPLVDTKRAEELAKLQEITAFSVELLRGHGGSLSSEHGDGRVRSWINERFFGPDLYRLYRRVKEIFDPRNLFNPGTVVNGPPVDEGLRFGAGYRSLPVATRSDWSDELGFDRAVEMCNGAGVCRKTTGTMCPSFMVTREEEHSTRGRANALRAVLSGRLPASELTGRRLYDAMDLCISCKGCKAECPSSVDMARIKTEFLAGYHAARGVPVRDRLFGGIGTAARALAGPMAPAVNALLGAGPSRWLVERALGVSSRRPPPRFARRPWEAWWRRRGGSHVSTEDSRGRVVLLVDTFANYLHPEVGIAATELIEAAGFEVIPSRHGCCGRPMLSKGLVEEARVAVRATLRALAPAAESGLPIVGLEPSCLLTLRDEARWLLPGDPRVAPVAARAQLFEEWIAAHAGPDRRPLPFAGPPRRLLLHGHCHQKALAGTGAARHALTLPPGWQVEEVDSGCCGMAGSFGYEREHYELSIAMAERRLAPAVRDADRDTLVVAGGTSCREQIVHTTGRRPLHPAQALRLALPAKAELL
ncbi:MAG: FAD-linked oxidase C-terminal domain-containing protein [Thermoanaerobaculia bacterium]|nr:FAD-linked oxidase C-terminal domain-containing protein [Thermoanaerobaculia bacterium]